MSPWFITGFTDGEGCFYLQVFEYDKNKNGWRVKIVFNIILHSKDLVFLKCIQNYFKVGKITKHGLKSLQFRVSSIKDLAIIIDHFEKYPLHTQKRIDF